MTNLTKEEIKRLSEEIYLEDYGKREFEWIDLLAGAGLIIILAVLAFALT